jgi:hypothetical protein
MARVNRSLLVLLWTVLGLLGVPTIIVLKGTSVSGATSVAPPETCGIIISLRVCAEPNLACANCVGTVEPSRGIRHVRFPRHPGLHLLFTTSFKHEGDLLAMIAYAYPQE